MSLRLIRRTALAVLALLAFAHARVALAACAMDRAGLAQTMTLDPGTPCEGDAAADRGSAHGAPGANGCVAHCTADLQAAGFPVILVRSAAGSPVLTVATAGVQRQIRSVPQVPPPGEPPRRVLLHSYLI